jgi:hypothetical protein
MVALHVCVELPHTDLLILKILIGEESNMSGSYSLCCWCPSAVPKLARSAELTMIASESARPRISGSLHQNVSGGHTFAPTELGVHEGTCRLIPPNTHLIGDCFLFSRISSISSSLSEEQPYKRRCASGLLLRPSSGLPRALEFLMNNGECL